MKVSDEGIKLIASFEGLRLEAYKDAVGIPTIGYGHTKNVKMGQKITKQEAEEFLRQDLQKAERNVNGYVNLYHFNQNQFDALVSFAFNVGSINQLVQNGHRPIELVQEKILVYNKAGGRILNGLVRRRKAEYELFKKGSKNNMKQSGHPTLRLKSKGKYVSELQTILNEKGYELKVDGIFGSMTETTVKIFQHDNKLVEDGIVGKNTWKALGV